ncbi:alpha-L-fucosidase, partial [bacterium]|nr:alpha-L-fucosidase [bacterium]
DLMDVPGGWDLRTPEQVMVREPLTHDDGSPLLWETCQTFSGSWGYHREESTWKSAEQLLLLLIDTVSKGGNLLLNVGPTGRGEFDDRARDRLAGMGEWMKRHDRAITGCGQAPAEFQAPQDCRLTYNADTRRLYVHVLNWPISALHLDGLAGKIQYAQLLNDASEIHFVERTPEWQAEHQKVSAGSVTLKLPVAKPPVTVPVIELLLK